MRRFSSFWNSAGISRLRRALRILITGLVALSVILLVVVVAFAGHKLAQAGVTVKSVPALTHPERAPLPGPVSFYSADGKLLGSKGVGRRTVLSPRSIPPVVRQATVAIEDQRFYQHNGVDLQGAARALWVDFRAGSAVQGGSTLTMQYVRNVYLDFSKTANRKLAEVALALQLEGVWTKQRILTAYLNTVYYGEGAYGIEAAAKQYFNLSALQLSTDQAALLAGIVQNPSGLNPRQHPKEALIKRNRVLDEMYGQGMISISKLQQAKAKKLQLRTQKKSEKPSEPALMELLYRESLKTLGKERMQLGGLKIYATFKMSALNKARKVLRAVYSGDPKAPIVSTSWVESGSGRVLLLANSSPSSDYFDFSWQARRQPGSTVKAFTSAAHLLGGGQLSDPVNNSPLKVKNGSKSYTIQPTQGGVGNIFDSLRFSQNPASWRLYQQVGGRKVLKLERSFGLNGMDANSAAALGGVKVGTNTLELAGAFSVFAGDGKRAQVHAVQKAVDRIGNSVWSDNKMVRRQIYPDEYARQMNVALGRVVNEGFPQLRDSLSMAGRRQVAGKTGTTEKNGDAWFAGYVPQMAGAVWTGYAKNTNPLTDAQGATVWGSTVPAQTWNKISYQMLSGRPALRFPRPRGVQRVPNVSGQSKDQAIRAFEKFGFTAVTPRSKFSTVAKPNAVIGQSPQAGSWIKRSTSVVFSYATDSRPAPQLVGRNFLSAEKELGRFARLQTRFKVSSAPLGQIIAQSPVSGFPLRYREVMIITIATSPGPVRKVIKKVPYVPSGSELAQLRLQLEQAQNSQQSTETQLVIPNLIGLSAEQAQLVLSSMGVNSRTSGSGATVIGQTPSGASLSSVTVTVKLKLG